MEMRTIGSLKVSVIGLGCNNFGRRLNDEQSAAAVVNAALDAGSISSIRRMYMAAARARNSWVAYWDHAGKT